MQKAPVRILSNLSLPPVEGFDIRTFGNPLGLEESGSQWNSRAERRSLAEILELVPSAERPDMLVCASPEYLPIPRDVASFKGTRILLITDWNVCLRFLPSLCGLFDFCFIDAAGFRLLREAGIGNVHHQPLFGHHPRVFRDLGLPRDLALSFCGNRNSAFHPERNRLLHQVAHWGDRRPIHLRQAFGDSYVDVLNRSRMVFNYAIRGEANMRLFETMACGAAPLVEEGNLEVPMLLREDVHYLTYPRLGLRERLDALAAQPARLAEVAAAAMAEAPRHTKASQLRIAFSFAAGQGPGFSGSGDARLGASSASKARPAESAALRAGRKAIDSLRILGCNQSLEGAMRDFQSASGDFPELSSEAVPALLMSGVEARPEAYQGAMKAAIDRGSSDPSLPPAVRAFARLNLASLLGNFQDTLAEGELCLRELAHPDGFPSASDAPYALIYFPPEIGRGFNTDLNRACRSDLESRGSAALRELLVGNALHLLSRALLALGRPAEALVAAEAMPIGAYASFDRLGARVECHIALGETEKARPLLRQWFAEWPLDSTVWRRVWRGMAAIGDAEGLAFLELEIPRLLGLFLPPGEAEKAFELVKKG